MTDFEIMDKMAAENMDIAMCPDLIAADKVKAGGKITFGVPPDAFEKVIGSMASDMMLGNSKEKYYVVMYIIKKKQFEEIKGSLNADKK